MLRSVADAPNNLDFSPAGQALLETCEGLRLAAYRDVRGRWTIGYGHTGPEVVAGLTWTQEQAVVAMQEDTLWAARCVNANVKVVLNQNQFDALVSFTYNVGVGDFNKSTLLVLLNSGDYDGASEQFMRWVFAGTQVSDGLKNRREKEQALFNTPVQQAA